MHLVQPAGLVPQPTLPRQTLTFGTGEGGKQNSLSAHRPAAK